MRIIPKLYKAVIYDSIEPSTTTSCRIENVQVEACLSFSDVEIDNLILEYVNIQYALSAIIATAEDQLQIVGFVPWKSIKDQMLAAKTLFNEVSVYRVNNNEIALSLNYPTTIAKERLAELRKAKRTNSLIDSITTPDNVINTEHLFKRLQINKRSNVSLISTDPFIKYLLASSHYQFQRRSLKIYCSFEDTAINNIASQLSLQYNNVYVFTEKDSNKKINTYLTWLNDDELLFNKIAKSKKLLSIIVVLFSYIMLQLIKNNLWVPLIIVFVLSVAIRYYFGKLSN